MKKNNNLWELESAIQSAKDIQFWRSEYVKRKILSDSEYNDLVYNYEYIREQWVDYLKNNNDKNLEIYNDNIIRLLQNSYVMRFQSEKYYPECKAFIDNCNDFISRIEVKRILGLFFKFSTEYGYTVDVLLSPTNMENILRNIDNELPDPPLYHINKYSHKKFSDDVLSLFHTRKEHESNLTGKCGTELEDIAFEIYKICKDKYNISDYTGSVSVNGYNRFANFIITGQTLHKDFDLDEVCKEIRDHLIWIIYEDKKRFNIPLKDLEKEAVIDLYKRMAIGEYGATYRAARAIGLWIWDAVYRFENVKNRSKAIDKLRAEGLATERTVSDKEIFYRYAKNAEKCIKNMEVIGINK